MYGLKNVPFKTEAMCEFLRRLKSFPFKNRFVRQQVFRVFLNRFSIAKCAK
jgi:hypothetical protein